MLWPTGDLEIILAINTITSQDVSDLYFTLTFWGSFALGGLLTHLDNQTATYVPELPRSFLVPMTCDLPYLFRVL